MQRDHHRNDLLEIYQAALRSVEGRAAVAGFLRHHDVSGPVYLVAIGKAAASMTRGACEQLEGAIAEALVITRHGYGQDIAQFCPGVRLIEAGHPVPDSDSLVAGHALLDFIRQVPADAVFLFLLSGGASSLVEVLPDGVSLADIQRVNQWLLASGLPIDEINRVRKSLSCIKGGRLLEYLPDRSVWNLLISDVPGDDRAVIGSGLLVRSDDDPVSDTMRAKLPSWLLHLLQKAPSGLPDVRPTAQMMTAIVATSMTARRAVEQAARDLGYPVCLHDEDIVGDVEQVAVELASCLQSGAPALHIWGGETTVRLPANPGRGGRCQQLALYLARLLQNNQQQSHRCLFLAAGTDGSDGPENVAGALIDGDTIRRGGSQGLDADACLLRADAGCFLDASGDLLRTGVTGANVMDLMLGLKV